MPGARCTRSLAWEKKEPHEYRHREVHRFHPAFPHAMVLTVSFGLSSVIGLCCHRHQQNESANLTPASRRQNHTTSPSASVLFVSSTSASIASRPAFVTIASAPWWDETKSLYCCFYRSVKQK